VRSRPLPSPERTESQQVDTHAGSTDDPGLEAQAWDVALGNGTPYRAVVTRLETQDETTGSSRPHPVIPGYFETEGERRDLVAKLFNESAPHYDHINRGMSLGTGHRYRRQALVRARLRKGMKLLDVGCGTGVIAGHARDIVGAEGEVVGVDPSEGMLAVARSEGRITSSHVGMAEDLPIEDRRFNMVSMGYALRHVNDLKTAFEEYLRVLRPGGTVLILEITPPRSRMAFMMLKAYLRLVVPTFTRVTTRSRSAQELMSYYWETIEHCVPPESILDAMQAAGFKNVNRNIELGVFSEYTGQRPLEG
jgi:demethylmenaquinone methyltransferase/2-methoxy-6-polyprenyl-1,4-benzoquinol methylase